MNIKNITKAANLSKELDRQNHLIELLNNESAHEVVYVKSQYTDIYALTPNMRHALLDIARKDKESIIKQIEAL